MNDKIFEEVTELSGIKGLLLFDYNGKLHTKLKLSWERQSINQLVISLMRIISAYFIKDFRVHQLIMNYPDYNLYIRFEKRYIIAVVSDENVSHPMLRMQLNVMTVKLNDDKQLNKKFSIMSKNLAKNWLREPHSEKEKKIISKLK
ncbi:MAG: hypothetical protein GF313_11670 [Caldithrix sp.]|nr:hypothetical protein [Caldithrix sp.]